MSNFPPMLIRGGGGAIIPPETGVRFPQDTLASVSTAHHGHGLLLHRMLNFLMNLLRFREARIWFLPIFPGAFTHA